jgi:cysteine desulfurase
MAANNEIGVVQPTAEIGALAHARGAVFHVDAAQAIGKIAIDVNAMQIDLLVADAHKIYGPKGCGALFIRKRTELSPLICGGGQERGCDPARSTSPASSVSAAHVSSARDRNAGRGAAHRAIA